jgi:hypothetical protein
LGQLQELELGTLQEPELEQELALQVERTTQEQALPQQWDCKMKDPVEMRKMEPMRTKCTDFGLRSRPAETLAEEHRMSELLDILERERKRELVHTQERELEHTQGPVLDHT